MKNHQNPLDVQAGKAINEAAPTLLCDISEQETLEALSRLNDLVSATRAEIEKE